MKLSCGMHWGFVCCFSAACSVADKSTEDAGLGTDTDYDTGSDSVGDIDTDTDSDTDTYTDADCPVLTWVSVIGGTFQMGSTRLSHEKPVHSVTVSTFELLETEVTVSQYGECVTALSCTEPVSGSTYGNWGVPGRENHPVNKVDWNQAVAFCNWVGGRLPSESEWEYAASNGSAEDSYPWGEAAPTCTYAVMEEEHYGCGMDRTWKVCSKPAGNTSHGLCDMSGNVWEWVQDWYHDDYTNAPDDGSALEVPSGSYRVARGGSFYNGYVVDLRAAKRFAGNPSARFGNLGFRCARDGQ